MKALLHCAVLLAMMAACNPVKPPLEPGKEVPADSARMCAHHCSTIGLQLSSVVLAFNSVGCVCAPPPAAAPAGPSGQVSKTDGAAGAMVMAMGAAVAAAAASQQATAARRATATK